MGGTCGTMGEERKMYRVLVGKPKGKRPLGRTRHRWEDVIRMDLRETDWRSVEWIQLALSLLCIFFLCFSQWSFIHHLFSFMLSN
jgi:hypothetical protein